MVLSDLGGARIVNSIPHLLGSEDTATTLPDGTDAIERQTTGT